MVSGGGEGANGAGSGSAPGAKCTCCRPMGRRPPLATISFQEASYVPCTAWVGQSGSEASTGVSRFSLARGKEWPWVARMRWWAGLRGSGKGSVGGEVVVLGGGEGRGMRAKRCFSLVWTMERISGKVTRREASVGHFSWGVGLVLGMGGGGVRMGIEGIVLMDSY